MGIFDGLPMPPDKSKDELSRIDEGWVAARFDSLPHVVQILTSKGREGELHSLREQSEIIEDVVDEIEHAYHGGFNKAIQSFSQVAAAGSLPSDSFHLRGAGPVLKRKTPSELRGEQLKRRTFAKAADDSSSALQNLNWVACPPKNTKYVEMHLDEVFPAKKASSKLRLLSGKATSKESVLAEGNNMIKSCSISSNFDSKVQQDSLCWYMSSLCSQNVSAAPYVSDENRTEPSCSATEKSGQNRFRSVTELSLGNGKSDSGNVDVDKAFKGLGSRDPSGDRALADSSGQFDDVKLASSRKIRSEFHVTGNEIPVDFTLKTSLRILSPSPNMWFHRLLTAGTYSGMPQLSTRKSFVMLHSWVYPQSSFPPFVVSALSSAAGEVDFLTNRQLAWEDSFRNLYYMLRKKHCDIFYVYTSNFVVMFTATGGAGESKRKCNAYISQSTRGLRLLLSEHDVSFSMPFCSSTEEQISRDDLVELSEIERHNLGQTKRVISMYDVDNNPQSLLSFSGNESVHGLYNFLLNYKSFLTFLTGMDVPMLYSPVQFQNASLLTPVLRCKEIKTADHYAAWLQDSSRKGSAGNLDTSGGISYSIEAKDVCLPPWIISSICGAMVSAGSDFEASFTTDLNSAGLNVAIQEADNESNDSRDHTDKKDVQRNNYTFGIPGSVVAPELHHASIKGLKYLNGSYIVSIQPI